MSRAKAAAIRVVFVLNKSAPLARGFKKSGLLIFAALLNACGLSGAQLRTRDGQLAPCPSAPRCVSSTDPDPEKRVEPFYYRGSREAARNRLLQIVQTLPRARVVKTEDDYVHAEFSTALMGYVDDVEFLLPASQKRVHVRSAARSGYYDFGTNRERVELIREAWSGAGVP